MYIEVSSKTVSCCEPRCAHLLCALLILYRGNSGTFFWFTPYENPHVFYTFPHASKVNAPIRKANAPGMPREFPLNALAHTDSKALFQQPWGGYFK